MEEWLQLPQTSLFFSQVKESLSLLQSEPRYRSVMLINNQAVPMTFDMCAMQNAHNEGRIDALNELLASRQEIIDNVEEDEA